MIRTFIRAGGRQLVVLSCVAAVVAPGIVSASPMMDARSEAVAMGLDPDASVDLGSLRRAIPKVSGPLLFDNGDFDGVNGLASELNTVVSDSRTADDVDVTNAIWGVTDVQGVLLVSTGIVQDGRLEIYNPADQCVCPSGPRNPFLSNPPIFVFTSTLSVDLGTAFGLRVRQYEWATPGMNLTCGKYWVCPIQVGRGSGRGFFATSGSDSCNWHIRSTFFGFPNWVNLGTIGFPLDGSFKVYGNKTGNKNCCAAPGGGSCDLTPIETKLDDETRFTDDAELADLQLIIESRASQASVDALEAKADAMQLALDQIQSTLCDIVRLLHTPNGLRQATCNGVDYEWNGIQGGGGD